MVELTGLEKDALHIYVALLIYLTVCLIFRWKAWQWKPWLVVLAAALSGEALDIYETIGIERRTYLWGNWHDLWNTMLLPTVLLMTSRWTAIFVPRKPRTVDQPEER